MRYVSPVLFVLAFTGGECFTNILCMRFPFFIPQRHIPGLAPFVCGFFLHAIIWLLRLNPPSSHPLYFLSITALATISPAVADCEINTIPGRCILLMTIHFISSTPSPGNCPVEEEPYGRFHLNHHLRHKLHNYHRSHHYLYRSVMA